MKTSVNLIPCFNLKDAKQNEWETPRPPMFLLKSKVVCSNSKMGTYHRLPWWSPLDRKVFSQSLWKWIVIGPPEAQYFVLCSCMKVRHAPVIETHRNRFSEKRQAAKNCTANCSADPDADTAWRTCNCTDNWKKKKQPEERIQSKTSKENQNHFPILIWIYLDDFWNSWTGIGFSGRDSVEVRISKIRISQGSTRPSRHGAGDFLVATERTWPEVNWGWTIEFFWVLRLIVAKKNRTRWLRKFQKIRNLQERRVKFNWFQIQLIRNSIDFKFNWFGIQQMSISIDLRFNSFEIQFIWDSTELTLYWLEIQLISDLTFNWFQILFISIVTGLQIQLIWDSIGLKVNWFDTPLISGSIDLRVIWLEIQPVSGSTVFRFKCF